VPWDKNPQQMIAESDLPGTRDRFIQSQKADDLLVNAGYQKIGIDHFAKPNDPLAKASKTGRLRRNFQGYTTDNCDVLLGIGASSISRSKQGYIQNIVPTGLYKDSVLNGEIPAAKGYRYTSQDQIRAYMIERLMCDFEISFKSMTDRFGSEAAPYIDIAKQIAALDQDQLSSADPDRFYINPERLPFTRTVASWFDAHLTKQQFKFSKAI
jgi:oxygen-independent coproporphyrinogen-3 oxidase